MQFIETPLAGAYVIELKPFRDFRGEFARTFCANQFKEQGLEYEFVQSNYSKTLKKHTLRGFHYQVDGAEEVKLIRCIKGSILDAVIDLRKGSSTYGQHFKVELSESNDKMIYVPRGFAHGFLTLEEDTHIGYQVSNFYTPNKEMVIRWNDPNFGVQWPTAEPILSDKDKNVPDFKL